MILGIGVDVVELARFERAIDRTPRLLARLFAAGEQTLPVHSLAARFAAKEALIKALGGSGSISWPEMEVVTDSEGNPGFNLHGAAASLLAAREVSATHVSITHDAGVACAFVVLERGPR